MEASNIFDDNRDKISKESINENCFITGMTKQLSVTDELKLECSIVLSECQKRLQRKVPNYGADDIGVECYCEKANISFFDTVYLSKFQIVKTCNQCCPLLKK